MNNEEDNDIDPFLNEAIEVVIDMGQASASAIQRKFKVGYARASRIIDQMEERGIISGYQGSKPREILMTKERWEELKIGDEDKMASKYFYNETYYNDELGVTKTVKAETKWEFDLKVKQLNDKWNNQLAIKRKKDLMISNQDKATMMDMKQKEYIKEYQDILIHTLNIDDRLDWSTQYRHDKFQKKKFNKQWIFQEILPNKEKIFQERQVPQKSVFEILFKSLKERREQAEKQAMDEYTKQLEEYNYRKNESKENYNKEKKSFEENEKLEEEKFEKEKRKYNEKISEWRQKFESGDQEAVEKYIKVVLENSIYPNDFEKDYEIEYKPIEHVLIISYKLPNTEQISDIEGYKFIKSKNEIKEIKMGKKASENFYENIIFMIALRSIHEIFEATDEQQIDIVVFNGFVTGVDKSNGKEFTNCIISLQVERNEFEDINLDKIEPKACVKSLKGVFAGQLAQLAPVKPIMELNREDRRFIESKEILDSIGTDNNLAEMDWEDFEQLVREVFSKEFSKEGAEVNVTQSSRDGGVDAIAFDPDPIRGGKFVIQAKRYNNVVPISAVRDLYGTMINEGATKGILVTTSYFGSDSQSFVKDKPLTLIDGQNLIYMMKKYGYNDVYIKLRK